VNYKNVITTNSHINELKQIGLEKANWFGLKLETNTFKGHHLKIRNQFSNQFQQSCPMQNLAIFAKVKPNPSKPTIESNQFGSIVY